jgi:hypothetical protein
MRASSNNASCYRLPAYRSMAATEQPSERQVRAEWLCRGN